MLKILLDTSFILPILGIDVGITVRKTLEKLGNLNAELYYSRFNILEALWVAVRLAKRGSLDVDRFSRGLRSIYASRRLKTVNEDILVFERSLELYMMGHNDLIDNVLYSIALCKGLKLLTLDEELVKFIELKRLNRNIILSPEDIGIK